MGGVCSVPGSHSRRGMGTGALPCLAHGTYVLFTGVTALTKPPAQTEQVLVGGAVTQADPFLLCLPEPLASPPRQIDLQTQENQAGNQGKQKEQQQQQQVRVQVCPGLCRESKPWVHQKSLPEECGWVYGGWLGWVEGWEEAGV